MTLRGNPKREINPKKVQLYVAKEIEQYNLPNDADNDVDPELHQNMLKTMRKNIFDKLTLEMNEFLKMELLYYIARGEQDATGRFSFDFTKPLTRCCDEFIDYLFVFGFVPFGTIGNSKPIEFKEKMSGVRFLDSNKFAFFRKQRHYIPSANNILIFVSFGNVHCYDIHTKQKLSIYRKETDHLFEYLIVDNKAYWKSKCRTLLNLERILSKMRSVYVDQMIPTKWIITEDRQRLEKNSIITRGRGNKRKRKAKNLEREYDTSDSNSSYSSGEEEMTRKDQELLKLKRDQLEFAKEKEMK